MSTDTQIAAVSQIQGTLAPPHVAQAVMAIDRCREAFNRAFLKSKGQDRSDGWAKMEAAIAYRAAVPPLCGPQNINEFIACVTDGMLLQTISGTDGARLLYAAQVASQAFRVPPPQKQSTAA